MGTKHQGSIDEVKALDAYIKLMRASNTVTARVHRHLSGARLSVSQFGVLEALHHLGPMSQNTIAAKILKSGGNITTVIDNLEKRDLVERRRLLEDRRVVMVHLTEKGHQLIAELFPRHVRVIVEEMRTLSQSEQDQLGRLCRKLGIGDKDSSKRARDKT